MFYHKSGLLPAKKHTTFYQDPDKTVLYREELNSSLGFSGIYSTKYHLHSPAKILKIEEIKLNPLEKWPEAPLQFYHFFTERAKKGGNFYQSREIFLSNQNCSIATAKVTENTEDFYRNAYAHELIFVHRGNGFLHSEYGKLPFTDGDYLVIPKSTVYQLDFSDFKDNKLLIIESDTVFEIPRHFRNDYGQLLEHAPYCERDFRAPEHVNPVNRQGAFNLILKAGERYYRQIVDHHPFDLIGWDGYLFPFSFNIKEYCPTVGKIHLPPPVHLLFTTKNFVVCNFVPRLFDFHPEAIPAPYYHSNIDSDEVIYYAEGNFMSRRGIEPGSITLHPMGAPHGPQPGKTEESIGKKETYEYAVMVDTFSPLQLTMNVKKTMDPNYLHSWLD